jgi:hypothetical protein
MKRLGILALVLSALALTVLLSTPRNAVATTCTCLTTIHQTPTENAKFAVSCTEAQTKLYNKLVLDEATVGRAVRERPPCRRPPKLHSAEGLARAFSGRYTSVIISCSCTCGPTLT